MYNTALQTSLCQEKKQKVFKQFYTELNIESEEINYSHHSQVWDEQSLFVNILEIFVQILLPDFQAL